MLSKKQFALESLEDRKMMAGDVAVSVIDGDLMIQGDTNDNYIEVYQLSSGSIRVQGVNTTINGRSYENFQVSDDIFVTMQQGNNDVIFRNYNGGVRADYVQFNMSDGNDRIDVDGLRARGDVDIFTWGGDDDIQIRRSNIGSGPLDRENLKIRTGAGEDNIELDQVVSFGDIDLRTFDTVFADEDDSIDVRRSYALDDLFVNTGGGDDDVFVRWSTVNDDLSINTGDGADYAWLDQNDGINDLAINMGGGDDTTVVYRTEARRVALNGGAGNRDRLFTFNNDVGLFNHTGFEQRSIR